MLLGVASPWSERKGLQDYIALSMILPPEYVIVLIGLDKEQIESLPDNMVGLGRTQNQAELAAFYSMADILLSLSTGETFGMTMAEAYGCGTPVIVYDNTAQPEIVTPETGRVVKTGDIEALALPPPSVSSATRNSRNIIQMTAANVQKSALTRISALRGMWNFTRIC